PPRPPPHDQGRRHLDAAQAVPRPGGSGARHADLHPSRTPHRKCHGRPRLRVAAGPAPCRRDRRPGPRSARHRGRARAAPDDARHPRGSPGRTGGLSLAQGRSGTGCGRGRGGRPRGSRSARLGGGALSVTDDLVACFARDGYVVLRGLFDDVAMDELQRDMERVQRAVAHGEGAPEHSGTVVHAPFEGERPPYVHYVNYVTKISPVADAAFHHPLIIDLLSRLLGPGMYFWDFSGHGAIYQDARPGEGMTYTRIGWHSDHQSRPTSDIWP